MDYTTFIFLLQFVTSILVWALFAKWVVSPRINPLPINIALMILVAPHAIRHIGLAFSIPSVTSPEIPTTFAMMTAWGDYITAILAIISLFLLKKDAKLSLIFVWIMNVWGFADLAKALITSEAIPYLEGVWFIPTMLVPLLLVSHIMIFSRLIKKSK